MRHGVHDYMMKDSMARLGVAIERELKEAENRKERRRLAEGLSRRLKELVGAMRESESIEFIHRAAEDALQVIHELESEKGRGHSAD
jgi:hypothetical protein